MSASLFYGLRLAKGFFGKRSDKYAKIWTQSKQLRATGQRQPWNSPLSKKGLHAPLRGRGLVFIFCSCQNSQVFLFPLLPALNERQHLIEFDGFTLIRAAAVAATPAAPSLHHPTNPLARIFIAFYIIVLAVAYALNMPCPFCLSCRWLLFLHLLCRLLCRFHRRFLCTAFIMLYIFAPLFFLTLALCAASASVVAAACVDRKCLILKSVLHFVSQLRVWFRFLFLCDCVFFCAVLFSNNRLARFAFPFSFPWCCCCFGVLLFGLLVSISPGCRLFVRYMQMCRQLFALRICFSRRSWYAYVFVF